MLNIGSRGRHKTLYRPKNTLAVSLWQTKITISSDATASFQIQDLDHISMYSFGENKCKRCGETNKCILFHCLNSRHSPTIIQKNNVFSKDKLSHCWWNCNPMSEMRHAKIIIKLATILIRVKIMFRLIVEMISNKQQY